MESLFIINSSGDEDSKCKWEGLMRFLADFWGFLVDFGWFLDEN
jgi:hypothetical protein